MTVAFVMAIVTNVKSNSVKIVIIVLDGARDFEPCVFRTKSGFLLFED